MNTDNYHKPPTPHVSEGTAIGKDLPCTRPRLVIAGGNQPLNQALRFCLTSTLEAEVACDIDIFEGDSLDKSHGKIDVVLLDCLTWDWQTIENQLFNPKGAFSEDVKTVAFNVDSNDNFNLAPYLDKMWGVFYQDDSQSAFIEGMRAILNGQKWFSGSQGAFPTSKSTHGQKQTEQLLTSLSPREKEILQLVAIGMGNTEIATKLEISLHTVKTHIYNIYKKINVSNRLQATLWASAHIL